MLITFEGVDGCGKTTQLRRLEQRLIGAGHAPLVVREPGGTVVGEALRALVLEPATGEIDAATEALVYAAARAELVARVLEPALADGRIVLLDRYVDSSLAYQGGGRQLGVDRVLEANLLATGGRLPDVTVLVEVPTAVAAERLARGVAAPDRLEAAGAAFFARVSATYDEIAERFAERFVRVDGTASEHEVAHAVEAGVAPVLQQVGVRLAPHDDEVRA
ncbi:MAG: tmk [Thermoleophilia bacterium]|nr:tmk [Thermoleophilia bacterium]